MMFRPKRALVGVAALSIAGGMLVATGGAAFAAAPYEPDPHSVGSVTFLDANGVPVTSGSINSPLATYIVGSATTNATYTYADMYFATPASGSDPGNWSTDLTGLDSTYNPIPAAWPADVKALATAGKPVLKESSGDDTIATMIAAFPNTSTAGPLSPAPGVNPANYQNLYEVRLTEGGNTASYEVATVSVSGSTWTLVPFPDQTVPTTTTISANPASPITNTVPTVPVTLTTTVTPSGSVASGYTGGLGTVVVTDTDTSTSPATVTVEDTEIVAPGSTAPFTVTTHVTLHNPSTNSFTATFTPFNGTALEGSASTALPYNVSVPLPGTTTTLGSSNLNTAVGGDTVHFTGTVSTGTPSTPVTDGHGTVNVFNNSVTQLNTTAIPVDTSGNFTFDYVVPQAGGTYSITATFSESGVYMSSTSTPPLTHTIGANPNGLCTASPVQGPPAGQLTDQCTDQQTITGTVAPGTLTVSTPYTPTHTFNLPNLQLDPSTGTFLTASKVFGDGTVSGATSDIVVTDTRAGDLNWTLEAESSSLSAGTSTPIDSQNVGLTSLGDNPVPGFNTAGLHLSSGLPAAQGVPFGSAGTAGLGGGTTHDLAQATAGIGTVGIYGLLTLNAPTSTLAGTYTGTITFTVVGQLTGTLS